MSYVRYSPEKKTLNPNVKVKGGKKASPRASGKGKRERKERKTKTRPQKVRYIIEDNGTGWKARHVQDSFLRDENVRPIDGQLGCWVAVKEWRGEYGGRNGSYGIDVKGGKF